MVPHQLSRLMRFVVRRIQALWEKLPDTPYNISGLNLVKGWQLGIEPGSIPLLGHYGYLSVVTHARTFGRNSRMVRQGCVDDSPVGGGHGLQGYAPATLHDPARHFRGHIAKGGFPALAVTLHIQDHADTFPGLIPDDQVYEELERLEGLAPAPNQEARVCPAEIYDGAARIRVVGRPEGSADVYAGRLQDSAHCLGSHGGGVAALGNLGYPHTGKLSADTQETRLPST